MVICGLKITHDGGVALIDDGTLVFSVEMEKIGNRQRHSAIDDLAEVPGLLRDFGYAMEDVDEIVIDGWAGLDRSVIETRDQGRRLTLDVAPYRENRANEDVLKPFQGTGLTIAGASYSYTSFTHLAGHVAGTWCASPFGARQQRAIVLVWDGGTMPRLYDVDPAQRRVRSLGPIPMFIGHAYSIFAQHFGPFRREDGHVFDELSIAGKVMAYIALGTVREELLALFAEVYEQSFELSMEYAARFARDVQRQTSGQFADEDVLASFHLYLERLLVSKLPQRLAASRIERPYRLCVTGGCALNIKWNSALRSSGLFEEVWVPPFPNDAGSALGTACVSLLRESWRPLAWDVFRGPRVGVGLGAGLGAGLDAGLRATSPSDGWNCEPCDVRELARHLHTRNAPVVFLNDRAELGPRALGNRSILAPAHSASMKTWLNRIKGREEYRPVAPICLEEAAPSLFDPGCSDPFMLFDHRVRDAWTARIPAVVHYDGTARLQTVNEREHPTIAALLRAYQRLSGVPVLCNTSANLKGCGFFPDAHSAMNWGQVDDIWCQGLLYRRAATVSAAVATRAGGAEQ